MDARYGTPLAEHGQTGLLRDIAELMIDIESHHHTIGWDNSPTTVYAVCRTPDGYDVAPLRLGLHDSHPRDELAGYADMFAAIKDLRIMERLYPLPPMSHILVMEAWTSTIPASERNGRMLADIPGSSEARTALAAVGRDRLWIHRVRGMEPRFEHWTVSDMPDGGHMSQALVRLDKAAKGLYRQWVQQASAQSEKGRAT